MIKKAVILFLFLFVGADFYSQNNEKKKKLAELDSVIIVLNNYQVKDSLKVELLIEVFLRKDRIYNKQDTTYPELAEGLKLAQEINYELGKARALILFADRFNTVTQLDSALIYSLEALEIFEKYSNKEDLMDGYSMLSTIYNKTREYEKSVKMNLKSIELIKNDEQRLSFARLYFSTGKSFEGLEDFDNAIKYYKVAKSISEKYSFQIGSVIADGAIGHIYKDLEEYDKALPLILNALDFSSKSGHNQAIASSHLELGSIYSGLKKHKESIYHFEKSIDIFKGMGSYYELERLYNDLANSYENIGKYNKAIENYKLSANYSDSVNTKEKSEVVSDLQTKYETEKTIKEKKLAEANELISKQKAENSRKISIGAFTFAGVIFLLLFFIFNRLKVIRKQKKELDKAYEMLEKSKRFELAASNLKALKSQMNPHFIFNSLNSIQDLILQKDTDTSYDYIVLFADLVRNTLNYSNNEFISFTKEIEFLEVYLQLENLRFGDDFKFEIETNGIDEIKVPSLIIQPFLENSLKHGLMHKEGLKELSLEFKLEKELICIITDNGVGRAESNRIQKRRGNNTHASFAMGAIKKRLNLLSERFEENFSFEVEDLYDYDIAKGTKITVIIPFEEEF
jgi:tetratricopeptide (TPR) repeat protein